MLPDSTGGTEGGRMLAKLKSHALLINLTWHITKYCKRYKAMG